MINRGTILTLGLSVAMHGVLLGVGNEAMQYRGVSHEAPPIQAMLLPPPVEPARKIALPAPAVPAKSPPTAKPEPAPKPLKPVSKPSAQALTADEPDEAPPDPIPPEVRAALAAADNVPETTPDAAPETTDPDQSGSVDTISTDGWPTHGGILFRVFLGRGKFQVGEADHQWSHDGMRYRMEVKVKTTGVAALVRGLHYVQRSEGEIGEQGLKPLRFDTEQEGKPSESAEFDWSSSRVSIRRDGRERRTADVQAGDQDVLSIWHQIGIVGTASLPRTIMVASGKAAKAARLEAVGEENIALPIGRLDTAHIRARAEDGSLTIDIWLARRYGMLPVRIRMTDDKGEVLDQQAIRLHLLPTDDGQQPDAAGAPPRIELKEEQQPFPTANLYAN